MAQRHGIGKDSVARIWRDHGLKPWKVETFKISDDPAGRDDVGCGFDRKGPEGRIERASNAWLASRSKDSV
jgi:hypothetical protein